MKTRLFTMSAGMFNKITIWPLVICMMGACHVFENTDVFPPPFQSEPTLCRSASTGDHPDHCRSDTLGSGSCEIQAACEIDNPEAICIRGEPDTQSGTCIRVRSRTRRLEGLGDGPVSWVTRSGPWGTYIIASEDSQRRETRVGALEVSDLFSGHDSLSLAALHRLPWTSEEIQPPWLIALENLDEPSSPVFDVLRGSCQSDTGYETIRYTPCGDGDGLRRVGRTALSMDSETCSDLRIRAGEARNFCNGKATGRRVLFSANGQFEATSADSSSTISGFSDALLTGGHTLVVRPRSSNTSHLETWHPLHGQRSFSAGKAIATNADPYGPVAVAFSPAPGYGVSRDVGRYFVAFTPNSASSQIALISFAVDGSDGETWQRPRMLADRQAPIALTSFPGGFALGSMDVDSTAVSFRGDFFQLEGKRIFDLEIPLNTVFADNSSSFTTSDLTLLGMASLRYGNDLVVGALVRSGDRDAWVGWMLHDLYLEEVKR